MKKKLMSFFLSVILILTCFVPFQVMAEDTANVAVSSEEGKISQIVTVKFTAAKAFQASVAELDVSYPKELEIVEFKNGTVFEASYSQISGDADGSFKYVAGVALTADKQSVSVSASDVLFTLSFRIPDNATAGQEFTVSVNDSVSMFALGSVDAEGAHNTTIPCISTSGKITAAAATECAAHTFGTVRAVRAVSYISSGYSYKTCSSCGYVDSVVINAKKTNVFAPLGTTIRYAGSPSGIGAQFKVDIDAIGKIQADGYKVEIGIELAYGDRVETHVFYGDNVPSENVVNMSDGVISAGIENVKTQQKGTIHAYVKIIDPATGLGRTEKTYSTLGGSNEIAIVDIVLLMNFNKYTQSTRNYLNAVASGYID